MKFPAKYFKYVMITWVESGLIQLYPWPWSEACGTLWAAYGTWGRWSLDGGSIFLGVDLKDT